MSYIVLVTSPINLPGIYGFKCSPWIISNTGFDLAEKIELNSLYTVSKSVRGLQFKRYLFSFSPLGMRVTIPNLCDSGRDLSLKVFLIELSKIYLRNL